MKRALHIGLVPMEWSITILPALAASSITICGQYGDIFGRLKVFLYGIIIYFICSILLSIGTDLTIVMIGSVLRGIGGGFIVSGSLSVLKTLAGPKSLTLLRPYGLLAHLPVTFWLFIWWLVRSICRLENAILGMFTATSVLYGFNLFRYKARKF